MQIDQEASLRVDAIVLAAGRSSRMGSGHKLLADLGGRTVIERTVASILAASPPIRSVLAVLGHRADDVRRSIEGSGVRLAVAPDAADGLSASLRFGLMSLGDGDGILVALGDMPLVRPDTIRRVVERFAGLLDRGDPAPVVRPALGGRPGHPVLWHRSHRRSLLLSEGDRGGHALLRALGEGVSLVDSDDPGIETDIDTDEALETARSLLVR